MSKGSMLTDLARISDVSVSTVDRVLKSRARVSASKTRRILSNAWKFGFTQFAGVHTQDYLRVAVLIDESTRFPAHHIANGFNKANPFTASREIFFTVNCCCKESIKQHLTSIIAGTAMFNAVVIICTQDIEICSKLGKISKKIPVLTMFSDLPSSHRQAYLGLNNRDLGWSLGEMLKRELSFCSPEIYIVPGQINLISDEQQEMGFRSFVRKHLKVDFIKDMIKNDLNEILNVQKTSIVQDVTRDNEKIIFLTGHYLFSMSKFTHDDTPYQEQTERTLPEDHPFKVSRYHAFFSNTLNEIIERAMVLITFMDVGPRIHYNEFNYLPFNIKKDTVQPD